MRTLAHITRLAININVLIMESNKWNRIRTKKQLRVWSFLSFSIFLMGMYAPLTGDFWLNN